MFKKSRVQTQVTNSRLWSFVWMLKPRIALPAARSTHTRDLPVMTISSINFRTTDEHIFLRWEIIYSVYFCFNLSNQLFCLWTSYRKAQTARKYQTKQIRSATLATPLTNRIVSLIRCAYIFDLIKG